MRTLFQLDRIITLFGRKRTINLTMIFSFNRQWITSSLTRVFLLKFIVTVLIYTLVNSQHLHANVLRNGNFDDLPVFNQSYFEFNISGWTCTNFCQIDNCTNRNMVQVKKNQTYANCSGQVIDLNSVKSNEVVTQLVNLDVGTFFLEFYFFYPYQNANHKTLLVYFNNKLVLSFSPSVKTKFDRQSFSQQVTAVEVNNITLTMTGPISDSVGFRIGNVSLRRIYNEKLQNTIKGINESLLINRLISIPASRFILAEIINVFLSFERLQFYLYHNRNQSYHAKMFLDCINHIMALKGTFFQNQAKEVIDRYIQVEEGFIDSLNYKKKYSEASFMDKNSNGNGFLINNAALFVYSFPAVLFLLLSFGMLFRIFYHCPASRCLHRFSFASTFLLMLCEGNIQQFAFYALGEFRSFFSTELHHKWVNAFILGFFFLVLWTAIALIPWLRYSHGRVMSCLLQEYTISLIGIYGFSLDKGIFCLLVGSIHQLLLSLPNLQLILLFSIDIMWICTKIFFLLKKIIKSRLLVLVSILQNILRLTFQLMCYLYQNDDTEKLWLDDTIFPIIIYSFVAVWGLQIILTCAYLAFNITRFLKRGRKKQGITPINSHFQTVTIKESIKTTQKTEEKELIQIIFTDFKRQDSFDKKLAESINRNRSRDTNPKGLYCQQADYRNVVNSINLRRDNKLQFVTIKRNFTKIFP